MTDLETRVRDALRSKVDEVEFAPLPPERVERECRRRHHRRLAGMTASAGLVLAFGATAAIVASLPSRTTGTTVRAVQPVSPPTTSSAPHTTVTAGPAHRVEPPYFLASIGAGAEQTHIVRSHDGSVVRALAADPPGQNLDAISPDHRTLYSAGTVGCGVRYRAIDIASGKAGAPVMTAATNALIAAESPDRRSLAWVKSPRCAPLGHGSVPLFKEPRTLMLRDANDHVRTLATGNFIGLAWSVDGGLLATADYARGDLHVIAVAAGRRGFVVAPAPGCHFVDPVFSNRAVWAGENCGTRSSVVRFPLDAHTKIRRVQVAPAGAFGVVSLDVDPSGRWVVYALDAASVDGEVSTFDADAAHPSPRHLLDNAFQVFWVPPGVVR